jgi:hypothetical protein
MKKVLVLVAVVISMSAAKATGNEVEVSNEPAMVASVGESFKLINDTKGPISIHTGTGFVTLNKGGSTSIGCNVGKEVRHADSGKKGDVIFKITTDMCGKTIKLSEYIK